MNQMKNDLLLENSENSNDIESEVKDNKICYCNKNSEDEKIIYISSNNVDKGKKFNVNEDINISTFNLKIYPQYRVPFRVRNFE